MKGKKTLYFVHQTKRTKILRTIKSSTSALDAAALELLVLELLELGDNLLQGTDLALGLAVNIVAAADVHRVGGLLLSTDNKDKVVLGNLGIADLLVQGRVGSIDIHKESSLVQLLADLLGVGDQGSCHRDDLDLAGGQPEVPATSTGLGQNGNHALQGSQHGAVNNQGAREVRSLTTSVTVLESETLGQLEVELDGGALMAATQAVADQNVNLGSVESTILGVDSPGATETVKSISQMLQNMQKVQLLDNQERTLTSKRNMIVFLLTFSAVSQSEMAPKNFSGRVERAKLNSKPKMP